MTPSEARQSLGLSQSEMANLMGVHVMTLSKWERGERNPDKAAQRLIDLLGWLYLNRPRVFEQWRKEI